MRIRTIKPEFWTDKRVASWDHFTRLLFIGMWSAADDHGRGSAEPARLAAELFPYDLSRNTRDTLARVTEGIKTLSDEGRIIIYAVNDEHFFEVCNWHAHQKVDRPGKSRIPGPNSEFASISRHTRDTPEEKPRLEQGTGNREQGAGNVDQGAASPWVVKFGLEMPESLRTQPCLDAVNLWLKYKSERREPYKETGLRVALTKWGNEFTPAEFPSCVDHSIGQGWQGIYRPRTQNQGSRPTNPIGTSSDDQQKF